MAGACCIRKANDPPTHSEDEFGPNLPDFFEFDAIDNSFRIPFFARSHLRAGPEKISPHPGPASGYRKGTPQCDSTALVFPVTNEGIPLLRHRILREHEQEDVRYGKRRS
jgi:hypothetical protein